MRKEIYNTVIIILTTVFILTLGTVVISLRVDYNMDLDKQVTFLQNTIKTELVKNAELRESIEDENRMRQVLAKSEEKRKEVLLKNELDWTVKRLEIEKENAIQKKWDEGRAERIKNHTATRYELEKEYWEAWKGRLEAKGKTKAEQEKANKRYDEADEAVNFIF
jgi:hypothetical protein